MLAASSGGVKSVTDLCVCVHTVLWCDGLGFVSKQLHLSVSAFVVCVLSSFVNEVCRWQAERLLRPLQGVLCMQPGAQDVHAGQSSDLAVRSVCRSSKSAHEWRG